jgi:hypothetical protein
MPGARTSCKRFNVQRNVILGSCTPQAQRHGAKSAGFYTPRYGRAVLTEIPTTAALQYVGCDANGGLGRLVIPPRRATKELIHSSHRQPFLRDKVFPPDWNSSSRQHLWQRRCVPFTAASKFTAAPTHRAREFFETEVN